MNTIIVSAFITGTNQRTDRTIDKYLDFGRELMHAAPDTPKIIYLSSDIVSLVVSPEYVYCETHTYWFNATINTYLMEFNMSDMYYYGADFTGFGVNTGRPDKDTAEYMMVQNYKPEWMRMAVLFAQKHIPNVGLTNIITGGEREVPSRQASGSPSSRTAYALVGECPLRLNRRFLTLRRRDL